MDAFVFLESDTYSSLTLCLLDGVLASCMVSYSLDVWMGA